MKLRQLIFLTCFLVPVFSGAQTFMVGAGIGYDRNTTSIGTYLTSYTLPAYNARYYISPVLELNKHFGFVFPLHLYAQEMTHYTAVDGRFAYRGPPVPNSYIRKDNIHYKSKYVYLGYGFMPYVSFGNKVRFQLGAGIYSDIPVSVKTNASGKSLRYHYDADTNYVVDSYKEFDSTARVKNTPSDFLLLFQLGFQIKVGKYFRIQPALAFRKSLSINSLNVSGGDGKKDWSISLSLFYEVFAPKNKRPKIPEDE